MTDRFARSAGPVASGVSVITLGMGLPCMLETYLRTRLLPEREMSVTFSAGCISELTVAVTRPASALMLTTCGASPAPLDKLPSQSPMKGAACSGVIDGALTAPGAGALPACVAVACAMNNDAELAMTRVVNAERNKRNMDTPWERT